MRLTTLTFLSLEYVCNDLRLQTTHVDHFKGRLRLRGVGASGDTRPPTHAAFQRVKDVEVNQFCLEGTYIAQISSFKRFALRWSRIHILSLKEPP
jgi:hypothetical protein